MRNEILPYDKHLKAYAQQLRKNSTLSEVLLWKHIKNKAFGIQFHRQVPILHYIVDFYCHEKKLAIEIDGESHLYKYGYDIKRQGELEALGVRFVRFSDDEVKNEMFSVLLALETVISEIE